MGNILTKLCSDDSGHQEPDKNHARTPQDQGNNSNNPDQRFPSSPDQPSLKPSSDYKTSAPPPKSDIVLLDGPSVKETNPLKTSGDQPKEELPSALAVPSSSTTSASQPPATAASAASAPVAVPKETSIVIAKRALTSLWSRSIRKTQSPAVTGSTGSLAIPTGGDATVQEAAATVAKPVSLAQGLQAFAGELSADDQKLLLANEIPAAEIEKLTIGVDAGGMGIIHVAEWKGIKVAIKEAQAHVISKEVEIYTRMLGYEGVVQFYGVTYPPGLDKLCIVTKYAENGSLSWHLKVNFSKLSLADKLSLATQMVSAVAQLHEKGIFHRDLHGGNILIDEAGNAMLTDFGASTMEERVGWAVNEFALSTIPTLEGGSKFVSELIPSMKKELQEYEERLKDNEETKETKEGEEDDTTNSSSSASRTQSSGLNSTLASSAPESWNNSKAVQSWSNSKAAVDAWGNSKASNNNKAAVDAWGNTKSAVDAWGNTKPAVDAWGNTKPAVDAWGNTKAGADHEESLQDALIGVMAYIAPERFRNPRHFDARCDIYSLGVLLWELTSGHGAFVKSPQDVQLAVSILNGKREEAVEGTPEKYQTLYERCWDPVPDRRPSLAEVLSTLTEVKAELSEEQLAVTRERNSPRDNDEGSDFEESLSVPRPTSDYQKYLLPEGEDEE